MLIAKSHENLWYLYNTKCIIERSREEKRSEKNTDLSLQKGAKESNGIFFLQKKTYIQFEIQEPKGNRPNIAQRWQKKIFQDTYEKKVK